MEILSGWLQTGELLDHSHVGVSANYLICIYSKGNPFRFKPNVLNVQGLAE
jgi:hypothetical protein